MITFSKKITLLCIIFSYSSMPAMYPKNKSYHHIDLPFSKEYYTKKFSSSLAPKLVELKKMQLNGNKIGLETRKNELTNILATQWWDRIDLLTEKKQIELLLQEPITDTLYTIKNADLSIAIERFNNIKDDLSESELKAAQSILESRPDYAINAIKTDIVNQKLDESNDTSLKTPPVRNNIVNTQKTNMPAMRPKNKSYHHIDLPFSKEYYTKKFSSSLAPKLVELKKMQLNGNKIGLETRKNELTNILAKQWWDRSDLLTEKKQIDLLLQEPITETLHTIKNADLNIALETFNNIKNDLPKSELKAAQSILESRPDYTTNITETSISLVSMNKEAANVDDFAHQDNKPIGDFYNISCNHPIIADKEICNFFDSAETRNQWVPDESNFYDQDNQALTVLPKFYSNSNDQERLTKPSTWMLDDIDIDNLLYQVSDEIWKLIFLAQNKYSIIEPDMYPEEKAATQWCAMKNIVNTSLVCKRFNAAAQKLLSSYTKEIKGYIDALGGKDKAVYTAFTNIEYEEYWFQVTEICRAMQADLNTTKHIEIGGNTFLTQAIRDKKTHKIRLLLQEGIDPKKRNRKGNMPIDLAYANGLLDAVHLIKDNGGDPEDKYEYKNGNFVCKQGQGGQAYAPQQANATATNNPPPIPPQTFSLASWLSQPPSYLFLAGISASAVVYWLYTKFKTTDEDTKNENDCSEVDVESEENCSQATVITQS